MPERDAGDARQLVGNVEELAHPRLVVERDPVDAALEEGLAAGVYGIPLDDQPRVRELLHIPDELACVAGITLGHRAPDPAWSKATSRATQRRRTLDEVVHWNTWD